MSVAKRTRSRARTRLSRLTSPPAEGPFATAEDPEGAAEYIAHMAAELANIAGVAGLGMLAYFLDMARVEAETHSRRRK